MAIVLGTGIHPRHGKRGTLDRTYDSYHCCNSASFDFNFNTLYSSVIKLLIIIGPRAAAEWVACAAGPSAPSRHRCDRIMDGTEDFVAQNPVTNPLCSQRGKGGGQVQLPVLTTGKAVPEFAEKGAGGEATGTDSAKPPKPSRNPQSRALSEFSLVEDVLNQNLKFTTLVGCRGTAIMILIGCLCLFHFILLYTYTFPNMVNIQKEGVWIFAMFSIAFFLLFVYIICRWKHRAVKTIKRRQGHHRHGNNVFKSAYRQYQDTLGLNGKFYLFKLYASEVFEKTFQVYNYFTLFSCSFSLSVTMAFCLLFFTDSALQVKMMYRKVFCASDNGNGGIITVAERDWLITMDICMICSPWYFRCSWYFTIVKPQ